MSEDLKAQLENLHNSSFYWALKCCKGDRHMAEEVLQNSYLKVISGLAIFREQSSLKTWFFGVIKLTSYEQSRKSLWKRMMMLDDLSSNPSEENPSIDAIKSQEAESIKLSLSVLSQKQQEVLDLVIYHDLTLAETAEVLNMKIGTVRKHYDRAKEKLRVSLKKHGIEAK